MEERARIRVTANGPYVVEGPATAKDHLGVDVPLAKSALCRCGGSSTKPFCDGTHARNGFRGDKDPGRVADERDSYRGVAIEIFDNRGICQHSGLCTDRLRTVFHSDSEPFVTPSGGRVDEMMRAVRDCPSGALGFAIDGRESRAEADWNGTRPPEIEIAQNGPYRITGGIEIVDDAGLPVERNAGASLEHCALCRCGQSRNKPFCSGMHWYVNFQDPPVPLEPTLFEWVGGYPMLERMARRFYESYVPEDALLAPLFAEMSPDHPQRVAAWLGEVFGGPKAYTEHYGGYARMVSQHIGKGLSEERRARWVQLLVASANDVGIPADAEFRAAFAAYIEWGTRIALENSQPGAVPPPQMPVPAWSWVCNATPGARISALAKPEPTVEIAVPAADETVSYERHVKGLFRSFDRQSMRFAFDLWAYDDAKRHGASILERVRAGTMPCDGPWPQAKIDVFARWLETGTQP